MRKQPRISTAPIIQQQAIQQGVYSLSPVISTTSISVTNTTATTNLITTGAAVLGFVREGQAITFGSAIGGLSTSIVYYVILGSITLTTFQVSATPGGPPVVLSTAAAAVTATTYTYISVPVNSLGTIVNLTTSVTSLIGLLGTVFGQSTTFATVTLTNGTTTGLVIGQAITGTGAGGSLGSNTTITSITSSTTFTITTSGGNPANGAVTNIQTTTPQIINAPSTWYLDITGIPNSINYQTTVTVLISQGGTVYNPTLIVNGITPTLIGTGNGGATSRITAYYYSIICTAPDQYSYSVITFAV